jgi:hypothetical protein
LKELVRWSTRARELDAREQEFHASLHPDVKGSVGRKRLLLLRELLLEARFPGAEQVFDSMVHGFDVVGAVPASGVFPAWRREAVASIDSLMKEAPAAKRAHAPRLDPSLR